MGEQLDDPFMNDLRLNMRTGMNGFSARTVEAPNMLMERTKPTFYETIRFHDLTRDCPESFRKIPAGGGPILSAMMTERSTPYSVDRR